MKSFIQKASPWVALALALWAAADPVGATTGIEAVRGTGWATSLACATCLGGAFLVLSSGWGAITTAIWTSGSAYAAAGCIAVCADALL